MTLRDTAVVFSRGIFAAVAVPGGYFICFGPDHKKLPPATIFLIGWALPVTVLDSGNLLALNRLLAANGPPV